MHLGLLPNVSQTFRGFFSYLFVGFQTQLTAELRELSQGAGLVPKPFSEQMRKSKNPPHQLPDLKSNSLIKTFRGHFRNQLMVLDHIAM